jgi:hypothetical protein
VLSRGDMGLAPFFALFTRRRRPREIVRNSVAEQTTTRWVRTLSFLVGCSQGP